MIRKKKLLKSIALFFLANIMLNIILPAVIGMNKIVAGCQQIHAGVDPPDIVDVKTGDMHYNVPLLDLPGAFSFNLSYSAGIKPTQEASWIGLGWDLNPGEISRTVNGYPDDYNGPGYENYYAGTTASPSLPSSPSKQYISYGCLKGYNMTLGKTIGSNLPDNYSFDTYVSHYPDNFQNITNDGYVAYQPKNAMAPDDSYFGGSFPNYDGYSVSGGAGVMGFIQPLILENPTLYHNNRNSLLNSRSSVIHKLFTQSKPSFRYINDFAGYYNASNAKTFTGPYPYDTVHPQTIDFSANPLGYTYSAPSDGFNSSTYRLAGSRHVEYYTNSEIADLSSSGAVWRGFVGYQGMPNTNARNTVSLAGTYTFNVQEQIGGFSITDDQGIMYHYALPVYVYNKYEYSKTGDGIETATLMDQAHAYKWLLTTITGPDFVDRNKNGYADENDWGAWTNFMYGRYTDQYGERSPFAGYFTTQNGSLNYTQSKREVYYLDAAYTRTHAVLFSKDTRADANNINGSLQLKSVLLLTAESIKNACSGMGLSSTTLYDNLVDFRQRPAGISTSVLDKSDLQSIGTYYTPKVIQEARLTQDYSVCPNAPNTVNGGIGKLTLNSVSYYGRNGSQSSPNYDFTYDLQAPYSRTGVITWVPGDVGYGTRMGRMDFGATANNFQLGDIIQFTISSVTYYAVLTKGYDYYGITNALYDVVFLGASIPGSAQKSISTTATVTKNPPYTEGYYDTWGNFKSDYDYLSNPQNKYHKTSQASAAGVDVWSLRRISTPTGALIDIEYESDTYSEIAASNGNRILNVHPNIGFYPINNLSNYSNLIHDSQYYFGLNFSMNDIGTGIGHSFKLHFLEPDAANAILQNVTVGSTVQMVSMCNLRRSGADDFYTKSANVTVFDVGSDINGPYVVVIIPRNDLGGLPFVDNTSGYTNTVHLGSYLVIGNKMMMQYGGGVRVKSVSLSNGGPGNGYAFNYKTTYDYNKPGLSNTSGSISNDPNEYDLVDNAASQVATYYPYTIVGSTTVSANDLSNYKSIYAYLLNPYEAIRYFAPPPNVNYEFVTVKNYGNGTAESTYDQYVYSVFRNSMVNRQVPVSQGYYHNYTVSGAYYQNDAKENYFNISSAFKDFTSAAGLLLAVNTLDQNDKIVARKSYQYSNESTLPSGQGVVGQVFHEDRVGALFYVKYVNGNTYATDYSYKYTIASSFHRYPTVLLNVQTTDYLKGQTDRTDYKTYDLYNGAATEIINRDSYGNVFKTKRIPAYRYANSSGTSLGLKMYGYRNMLSQIGEEYIYRVDPANYDNHLGVMSGKAINWAVMNTYRQYNSSSGLYENTVVTDDPTTAQNEIIYRPIQSYLWSSPLVNADGSFSSFQNFWTNNSGTWQIPANWKNIASVKLYDPYSNILSAADVNGNLSSVKYTKNKSLPLTTIDNASYGSFAYTSFEDFNGDNAPTNYSYLDGELNAGFSNYTGSTFSRTNNPGMAHTGTYVCSVVPGYTAPVYVTRATVGDGNSLQPGKTYRASVWVNEASAAGASLTATVTGAVTSGSYHVVYGIAMSQATIKNGKWYLLNLDFDIPSDYYSSGATTNNVTIALVAGSGTTYFDDFSFRPLDSDIKGYVYDATTWKLTHVLDKDNFYTRYEYDDNNRLKAAYRETVNGEVKIKDVKYNVVK